jgi:BarA-like signal transduction histidine kinase
MNPMALHHKRQQNMLKTTKHFVLLYKMVYSQNRDQKHIRLWAITTLLTLHHKRLQKMVKMTMKHFVLLYKMDS